MQTHSLIRGGTHTGSEAFCSSASVKLGMAGLLQNRRQGQGFESGLATGGVQQKTNDINREILNAQSERDKGQPRDQDQEQNNLTGSDEWNPEPWQEPWQPRQSAWRRHQLLKQRTQCAHRNRLRLPQDHGSTGTCQTTCQRRLSV